MKIFVSYARVDKPYCIRIIETLHAHDVWYDQRLYAGQDWWKEILRRLDWSEVFVYLLSPDSVASLYCRRELELALRLKRDIIPVLINSETVLPETMKDWQYVDLSDSLTVENVSQLLNAVLMVERQRASSAGRPAAIEDGGSGPAPTVKPAVSISEAVRALENGEYDKAVMLLKQAQASGYQSRFVSLDKLLRIAESSVNERSEAREVEREYQHIVALFAFESTRQMACEALEEFRREFGDYDPQGLWRRCETETMSSRSFGSKPRPANNIRQVSSVTPTPAKTSADSRTNLARANNQTGPQSAGKRTESAQRVTADCAGGCTVFAATRRRC